MNTAKEDRPDHPQKPPSLQPVMRTATRDAKVLDCLQNDPKKRAQLKSGTPTSV